MIKKAALIVLATGMILAWVLNLSAATNGVVAYPLGYGDWPRVKPCGWALRRASSYLCK
jgi:hypothetical protein